MGPTSTLHCVLLKQRAFFVNAGVALGHAVLEAPEPSCEVLGPRSVTPIFRMTPCSMLPMQPAGLSRCRARDLYRWRCEQHGRIERHRLQLLPKCPHLRGLPRKFSDVGSAVRDMPEPSRKTEAGSRRHCQTSKAMTPSVKKISLAPNTTLIKIACNDPKLGA